MSEVDQVHCTNFKPPEQQNTETPPNRRRNLKLVTQQLMLLSRMIVFPSVTL
jgi:hypothetical protein